MACIPPKTRWAQNSTSHCHSFARMTTEWLQTANWEGKQVLVAVSSCLNRLDE